MPNSSRFSSPMQQLSMLPIGPQGTLLHREDIFQSQLNLEGPQRRDVDLILGYMRDILNRARNDMMAMLTQDDTRFAIGDMLGSVGYRQMQSACLTPSVHELGSTGKGTTISNSDMNVGMFFDVDVLRREDEYQFLLSAIYEVLSKDKAQVEQNMGVSPFRIRKEGRRVINMEILDRDRLGFSVKTLDITIASSVFLDTSMRQSAVETAHFDRELNSGGLSVMRRDIVRWTSDEVRNCIRDLKAYFFTFLPAAYTDVKSSFTSYVFEVIVIAAFQFPNPELSTGAMPSYSWKSTLCSLLDRSIHLMSRLRDTAILWKSKNIDLHGRASIFPEPICGPIKQPDHFVIMDPIDPTHNLAHKALEPFVRHCENLVKAHEKRGRTRIPRRIFSYGGL